MSHAIVTVAPPGGQRPEKQRLSRTENRERKEREDIRKKKQ